MNILTRLASAELRAQGFRAFPPALPPEPDRSYTPQRTSAEPRYVEGVIDGLVLYRTPTQAGQACSLRSWQRWKTKVRAR